MERETHGRENSPKNVPKNGPKMGQKVAIFQKHRLHKLCGWVKKIPVFDKMTLDL